MYNIIITLILLKKKYWVRAFTGTVYFEVVWVQISDFYKLTSVCVECVLSITKQTNNLILAEPIFQYFDFLSKIMPKNLSKLLIND